MKHLSFCLAVLAGCAAPVADVTISSADFGVLTAPGTVIKEVRVTNVGSAVATLERLERAEGSASMLVITPTVRLEPGQSTTWKVKFDAHELGLTTTRFRAVFDTGTASFLARGRLVEACAPIDLDLGDARVGSTVTRTLELTNPLDERRSVTVGALEAPFSLDVAGTLELAPRETRPVTVRFAPASEGDFERSWLLSTRTDCFASSSLVRGRGLAAPLTLVPGRLHFGAVAAGAQASATVELRNSSGESVRLTAAELSDSTNFTFDTALPVEVPAGGAALLTLSARPSDASSLSAVLTLTTDAQGEAPLTLPLLANVSRACMTASATQLDFGTGETGCRSTGKVVSFVNQCPHPVRLSSVELPTGFSLTSGSAPLSVVAAGASVTLQVVFTPVAAGPTREALLARFDVLDGSEDAVVSLSGEGTPAVVIEERYLEQKSRLDVVIVLDDGPQMLPAASSVAIGLGELATTTAEYTDLRFAVMTTSTDPASIRRLRTLNGAEWLDNPSATELQQLGALTGSQSARSSCIDVLRAAFADPASGAQRMRRPDAGLRLICITNRRDEVAGAPLTAISALEAVLPRFVRLAVVAQLESAPRCGGTIDDGVLRLWLEEMWGEPADVCGSWATRALPPIHHWAGRSRFYLSQTPDFTRGPLKVSRAQVELPEGSAWSWDGMAVNVEPLFLPAPGDELLFRYFPECTF